MLTARHCAKVARLMTQTETHPACDGPLPLATCSLPVSLVGKMIRRLQQAIRIAQSSGCYTSADDFDALVCELRAHADRATERQPAENEPR